MYVCTYLCSQLTTWPLLLRKFGVNCNSVAETNSKGWSTQYTFHWMCKKTVSWSERRKKECKAFTSKATNEDRTYPGKNNVEDSDYCLRSLRFSYLRLEGIPLSIRTQNPRLNKLLNSKRTRMAWQFRTTLGSLWGNCVAVHVIWRESLRTSERVIIQEIEEHTYYPTTGNSLHVMPRNKLEWGWTGHTKKKTCWSPHWDFF